jgi:hypothetical protein
MEIAYKLKHEKPIQRNYGRKKLQTLCNDADTMYRRHFKLQIDKTTKDQ